MNSNLPSFSLALISAILAGCAATVSDQTSAIVTPAAAASSTSPPGSTYVLSADEQDLDCKKLTGRMEVRILDLRDRNQRSRSTGASQLLQSAVAGLIGGSKAGTDPDAAYAKDLAMLDAYNRQLAAKGCKSFDLAEQLKPKDVMETPRPTIPAPAKQP